MDEQQENMGRVSEKIAPHILQFFSNRLAVDRPHFHMDDLVAYVRTMVGRNNVAPDSTSRIMRQLRQKNELDYLVISRSESLYRIVTA